MSASITVGTPPIGQGIRVRIENIRNEAGKVVDPSTIVGKYEAPDGTETTVAVGSMTKVATGHYYFTFTPDASGEWTVRMETTSPDVAFEESFTVDTSKF